jgi:hypothetical protein
MRRAPLHACLLRRGASCWWAAQPARRMCTGRLTGVMPSAQVVDFLVSRVRRAVKNKERVHFGTYATVGKELVFLAVARALGLLARRPHPSRPW